MQQVRKSEIHKVGWLRWSG